MSTVMILEDFTGPEPEGFNLDENTTEFKAAWDFILRLREQVEKSKSKEKKTPRLLP